MSVVVPTSRCRPDWSSIARGARAARRAETSSLSSTTCAAVMGTRSRARLPSRRVVTSSTWAPSAVRKRRTATRSGYSLKRSSRRASRASITARAPAVSRAVSTSWASTGRGQASTTRMSRTDGTRRTEVMAPRGLQVSLPLPHETRERWVMQRGRVWQASGDRWGARSAGCRLSARPIARRPGGATPGESPAQAPASFAPALTG